MQVGPPSKSKVFMGRNVHVRTDHMSHEAATYEPRRLNPGETKPADAKLPASVTRREKNSSELDHQCVAFCYSHLSKGVYQVK